MNKHSELIGSFIRRTNSPIEADYIFKSEQELIDFYKLPENEAILHEGLFKIVIENDSQYLYWVINEGEGLKFAKLIEVGAQDTIEGIIKDLEEEINKREELEEFVDDINDRLIVEEEYTKRFLEELQEIIGADDENYMTFLKQLDFKSIKELSDNLKNIDDYLEGSLENESTLIKDLEKLILDIMGDPLPSKPYRTLRGIEDVFTKRKVLIDNKIKELQGEVDNIELGVGLEASGAYRPDQDTKYLKGTVSVMHALKVLDSMIDEAITHTNLTPVKTNSVDIQVKNLKEGTEISADVLLDQEGDIIERDSGLYYNVRFEVEAGNLIQYVNGVKRDSISLGLSSTLEDVVYDNDTEHIIITIKLNTGETKEVKLPVHDIIEEWEVKNDNPNDTVILTKTRNIKGKDLLSADVRISQLKDNQLEKRGNALYVVPPAFGEKELQDILDRLTYLTGQLQKLESSLEVFKEEVDEKFKEVHEEIERIEKIIEKLREDFETFKVWVQNEIIRIDAKIDEAIEDLNTRIDEEVAALEEKIDKAVEDLNTRIDEEIEKLNTHIAEEVEKINDRITNEVKTINDRIDSVVETLNNTIKELETKLTKLINQVKEDLESSLNDLKVELEQSIENLDTKLTELINNVVKDLTELTNQFNSFKEEVELLKNDLKALKDDFELLKNDFEKRIKALEDLTKAHGDQLESHAEKLSAHDKLIDDNKENIEKLQAIVDEFCYWWENE